jgi:outer membrane lipoprotein-sorting protein
MSTTSRPAARWAVPAGVSALVLGGAVLGPALSASAEVELPERSAEQLLTDLQTADVDAFSGTVAQRADLGLPALPAGMGGGEHSTDLMSLLDGENTLRVWASGDRARVSLHGELGELGVVSDGTEVWTWSSDERAATRLVLPPQAQHDRAGALSEAMPPVTPEQITAHVLELLEPSTRVTSGPNDTVAGRPAYELVLEPAVADGETSASLIGSVRIAVDAAEHVPTRVQVYAAGQDAPAIEVGFTELSFETPDDERFSFTPPAGTTVEEHTLDGGHGPGGGMLPGGPTTHGDHGEPSDGSAGPRRGAVVGSGWSTVLVGRAPGTVADTEGDLRAFLSGLPRVSGEWGSGRLLTSTLFSALLTDDGRLLVGAVSGDTLQDAAADPAADLG